MLISETLEMKLKAEKKKDNLEQTYELAISLGVSVQTFSVHFRARLRRRIS